MFSANQTSQGTRKDTVVNVELSGRFVWNLATYPLREAVNITATDVPYGVDEFERAGLAKTPSKLLQNPCVPMVKDSPVNFECEYYSTLRLPGNPPMGTVDVIIAKVIGIHIKEEYLTDGVLDVSKTLPIARCGYAQYTVVRETFEMLIPGGEGAMMDGLAGSSESNRKLHEERMGKAKLETGSTVES